MIKQAVSVLIVACAIALLWGMFLVHQSVSREVHEKAVLAAAEELHENLYANALDFLKSKGLSAECAQQFADAIVD